MSAKRIDVVGVVAKDAIDEFLVALEPDRCRAVTNGRSTAPVVRGTRKCALQSYFRFGFDQTRDDTDRRF